MTASYARAPPRLPVARLDQIGVAMLPGSRMATWIPRAEARPSDSQRRPERELRGRSMEQETESQNVRRSIR